jgi:hypothetical protein
MEVKLKLSPTLTNPTGTDEIEPSCKTEDDLESGDLRIEADLARDSRYSLTIVAKLDH